MQFQSNFVDEFKGIQVLGPLNLFVALYEPCNILGIISLLDSLDDRMLKLLGKVC